MTNRALTYAVDDGNGNQLTTGLDANTARRTAQRMADERNESVYLYAIGGEADETYEEIEPSGLVTIETMPDQYRDSHKAAGNWGVYPANGAVRERVSRAEAEEIVVSDADGYARIVKG